MLWLSCGGGFRRAEAGFRVPVKRSSRKPTTGTAVFGDRVSFFAGQIHAKKRRRDLAVECGIADIFTGGG